MKIAIVLILTFLAISFAWQTQDANRGRVPTYNRPTGSLLWFGGPHFVYGGNNENESDKYQNQNQITKFPLDVIQNNIYPHDNYGGSYFALDASQLVPGYIYASQSESIAKNRVPFPPYRSYTTQSGTHFSQDVPYASQGAIPLFPLETHATQGGGHYLQDPHQYFNINYFRPSFSQGSLYAPLDEAHTLQGGNYATHGGPHFSPNVQYYQGASSHYYPTPDGPHFLGSPYSSLFTSDYSQNSFHNQQYPVGKPLHENVPNGIQSQIQPLNGGSHVTQSAVHYNVPYGWPHFPQGVPYATQGGSHYSQHGLHATQQIIPSYQGEPHVLQDNHLKPHFSHIGSHSPPGGLHFSPAGSDCTQDGTPSTPSDNAQEETPSSQDAPSQDTFPQDAFFQDDLDTIQDEYTASQNESHVTQDGIPVPQNDSYTIGDESTSSKNQ